MPLSRLMARDSNPYTPPVSPLTVQASGKFNKLLDEFMAAKLAASPELATNLGMDTGAWTAAKSRLDDRSLGAIRAARRRVDKQLSQLKQFDRGMLSDAEVNTYDSLLFLLSIEHEAGQDFFYGETAPDVPYIVTQMDGAYATVPDLMVSKHMIVTASDVDAYLARLSAFPAVLDQESERILFEAKRGAMPPDFIIDRTCVQLQAFRNRPATSATLVTALERKCLEAKLPNAPLKRAAKIYSEQVVPAIDRQRTALSGLLGKAGHEAGVTRLPHGEGYYTQCLKKSATKSVIAKELHQTGLDLVAKALCDMDVLLRQLGYGQGLLVNRLRGLRTDARFAYPDTAEGKRQVLQDLHVWLDQAREVLPKAFNVLPKANVVIRPVPSYLEAGSPIAYYEDPSLDGTRPGTFFINLGNLATAPKWLLPTVLYHEAIPGHHLQQALVQERTRLPLVRQIMWFEAYGEGWAFYAEQLALELGLYEQDPWNQVGYIWLALLRAARLTVDTGLHAMHWKRDYAIEWLMDHMGSDAAMARTEVERYCVHPGQACSYMFGKLEWLRQRERARKALGPKFSLGDFHNAGLSCGAVPLEVLDRVIGRYIDKTCSA